MSPGGAARPRGSTLLLLLLPLAPARPPPEETGNVGCLYSDLVCAEDELCYDDKVIGRCLSASSPPHHPARPGPLGSPARALLEAEMTRVSGLGYTWPALYTQCVFQSLLHDIETRQRYSEDPCAHLRSGARLLPGPEEETSLEDEDTYITADGDLYTDPGTHYLDEEEDGQDYRPEEDLTPEELERAWLGLQQVLQAGQEPAYRPLEEDEYEGPLLLLDPNMRIAFDSEPEVQYLPQYLPPPQHQLEKRETSSYNLIQQPPNPDYLIEPEDPEYIVPDDLFENVYKQQPEIYQRFDDTDFYPPGPPEAEDTVAQEDLDWDLTDEEPDTAEDTINKRQDDPSTLMQEMYSTDDEEKADISNYDFDYEDSAAATDDDDIVYYNPDPDPISVESVFDRRERLDVKKPGPFFTNSPNNFFLDKLLPEEEEPEEESDQPDGQTEYELPLAPQTRPKKDLMSADGPLATLPEERPADTLTVHYRHLQLESQAASLLAIVALHLGLQPATFDIARQPENNRLILTVHANPKNLDASTMADLLNADPGLAEHAARDLNINIESFEAGNKDQVLSEETYKERSHVFLAVLIVSATLAAVLSAAGLLFIIRRRSQQKDKLEVAQEDEEGAARDEPVKEYKQLVRDWSRSSRASQGSTSAAARGDAPGHDSPGVKSGHKISQNSDGSRTSSTSSWQEEPTAASMDISTGHMVLSYMEDHLKNKQRLEQEWVGLCAYEAEPNSTAVAFKVENKKKNRYPDKLPYDHNRVLLNALVNGTNSDYINASTVMDHDPRNPAYIVSQGPMAHTVADFWQMVWEQGSVVIVMLSRLAENGYQLAQRYWPEEGSEQYHIFEVHLVSEHVWCEDYLVRSLYLKNSQTGETRTVTQFHFLSWPDGTTPASTRAILEFRRKVNKSYRGRSCPMVIHCSDGVGRSGTYVLIDMVLNRMTKGSKEIDIAATLEHIRDQRSGMVQTRGQFEFCLMAVAEETHAILKALPQ